MRRCALFGSDTECTFDCSYESIAQALQLQNEAKNKERRQRKTSMLMTSDTSHCWLHNDELLYLQLNERSLYNDDYLLLICCSLEWLLFLNMAPDALVVEGKLDVEFVCILRFESGHPAHFKTTPPSKEAANCPINVHGGVHIHEVKDKVLASMRLSAALQRETAEAAIPAQLWATVHCTILLFIPVAYAVSGSGYQLLVLQVAFFSICPVQSSILLG